MASVKEVCKISIEKLKVCADKCDQHVKNLVPKNHCVQPAKDAIAASKQLIFACRGHLQSCKNPECKAVAIACIKSAEKVVEKATACIDACNGAGSDQDVIIVCKDCIEACKACIKNCEECAQKVCS